MYCHFFNHTYITPIPIFTYLETANHSKRFNSKTGKTTTAEDNTKKDDLEENFMSKHDTYSLILTKDHLNLNFTSFCNVCIVIGILRLSQSR